MPGFSSNDAIIAAMTAGQQFKATWGKNFNPTAAAVANEYHTLFRGAGNPQADAIFNAGSTLVFQPVEDSTANAGTIQHGGNVQPTFYKYLASGSAVSAAATVVPGVLVLVDVIGFYRKTPITSTAADATTNTITTRGATFTVDTGTDAGTYTSTTQLPSNLITGTRIRVSTKQLYLHHLRQQQIIT